MRVLDNDELRLGLYMQVLRPLNFALEDFRARQRKTFGPKQSLSDSTSEKTAAKEIKGKALFDEELIRGDVESK
jgi:hypothetical protein